MAFDTHLGSFSAEEHHPKSRSSRLIAAAEVSNSCILPLDQSIPFWRIFETPLYRRFRESQEVLEKVALEMVKSKTLGLSRSQRNKKSLIEEYLCNENLDIRDIIGNVFFLN